MKKQHNCIWSNIKEWQPLTEIPKREEVNPPYTSDAGQDKNNAVTSITKNRNPLLSGLSPILIKLLWDILCYPFSSVSVRIKRLGISARAFENAQLEGCEKGFFFRSSAGSTIYLIPNLITFEAFDMPYLYKRDVSIEHSFYVNLVCFLLSKDPRNKSIQPEVKRGDSGSTSDIVTVAHDGTRKAFEITLSTTNVLANAAKYEKTDFAIIVFLCRDYKLREAVKACCREGGLNPDLLAKLEYIQFSTLLRRQRKLSLY